MSRCSVLVSREPQLQNLNQDREALLNGIMECANETNAWIVTNGQPQLRLSCFPFLSFSLDLSPSLTCALAQPKWTDGMREHDRDTRSTSERRGGTSKGFKDSACTPNQNLALSGICVPHSLTAAETESWSVRMRTTLGRHQRSTILLKPRSLKLKSVLNFNHSSPNPERANKNDALIVTNGAEPISYARNSKP